MASSSAKESNLQDILPANTLKTRVPQVQVERHVAPAPPRYRNEVSKYILRRSHDCIGCGKCAQLCPYGVHVRKPGYKYFCEPKSYHCIGPACEKSGHYCVAACPKSALQIVENPMMQVLGDYRWTADMILATWMMAETGRPPAPEYGFDYQCGNSGGGFDKLRFKFPDKAPVDIPKDQIDTSIELNRRGDGRPQIRIDVPWYGGGMSFGSVSNVTQLSKARSAVAWNTFTCTGEGGYMERMRPYDDHVITQVATGLFGVREETIQRVPIVEFKYAQGAKPGLGGHLLGDKNTPAVAKMREAVLGISLFSPFPFHSVYSIEDHMKHLDWIKHVNKRALLSTKVSTPTDVDMVAVGSYAAGTHIIHIDGGYGGTGASPDIAKKNIAMPIEYAIGKVHGFLKAEGVRDKVTLMASGGARTAHDVAKAIALGADGVVIGTAELVALGCVRCTRCESGRGCPRGIATTDLELSGKMDIEWGTQRMINLYNAWRDELVEILWRFGMRSISELRGRTDLLMHLDYTNDVEQQTVDRQLIEQLAHSRKSLAEVCGWPQMSRKAEEEGGCGVVGFCCTKPVPGRHIYEPSKQMHNRGNGKGGGIAAVGLVPEQLGVSRQVLDEYYMLHIAMLDPNARPEVEQEFIRPHFDLAESAPLDQVDDWQAVGDLEVKPPYVWRYFVRVKPKLLDEFIQKNGFAAMDRRAAEDEYVSQNSFRLNQKFYASLGQQRAFVLSHGRNIMILKVVGYAEAIVKYYKIEDLCAHAWIAHQRYPTKGRVWHPGGAHPFAAMNMALVHNGDFANYHSVSEYLKQRNIYPQFLTDTEVSALLFDLLDRTYRYPLEYIIEALAPTTELDFDRLSEDKQRIYKAIQATHIHGSPDGLWFFIIARNVARENKLQLIGITDTAMLRPQVFALCEGEVQVGLIASEKQAIDATLLSLHKEDNRICPVADRYWNARGGSHTDGGAFVFNLSCGAPAPGGEPSRGRLGYTMTCTDKFGQPVPMPKWKDSCDFTINVDSLPHDKAVEEKLDACVREGVASKVYEFIRDGMATWSFDTLRTACRALSERGASRENTAAAIEVFTLLNDRKYPTGGKRRSHVLHIVRSELNRLLRALPKITASDPGLGPFRLIDLGTADALRGPTRGETTLVIDALGFPPEGDRSDASLLRDAFMKGWRRFITFDLRGQRFHGCGLGPETDDVVIDIYGSSGDYLGSGIDGLTITVHGNAQDQLGQIIKRGKLVVHGDVGQTFMYGAKGGSVFILANAAGRPLINSVGRPKVVINGTCLDFLAESFMAGDPLAGGGFVILNGIRLDDDGKVASLAEPYPGSNLFSLASGGAIYVRDPHKKVVDQQLNGGKFTALTQADWDLILPYLEENERLFGIHVSDLLTVGGKLCRPEEVYRKVAPVALKALAKVAALPGKEKRQAAAKG